MTSEIQKEIEIIYATNAANSLGKAWNIKQTPNEQEWPDLLVTFEGEVFGLEVREIYLDESRKGSNKKANENRNIQNLNAIAEKYYSISEIPLRVRLLGPYDNEGLILDALRSIDSGIPDFEYIRLEPCRGCVLLVTKLPAQFKKYKEWVYLTDRVGWVGEINDDIIQEKVNEKSKKLDKYTKNIKDIRLLLVCDPVFNSGKFEYTQVDSINHKGFKEIYFLSNPNRVCQIYS